MFFFFFFFFKLSFIVKGVTGSVSCCYVGDFSPVFCELLQV